MKVVTTTHAAQAGVHASKLAFRKVSKIRCLLNERFRHGRLFQTADTSQQIGVITLRLLDACVFPERITSHSLWIRGETAWGDVWFSDAEWIHLSSGILIDPTWPQEELVAWLRIAETMLDPALTQAFGGAVQLAVAVGPTWEDQASEHQPVTLALGLCARGEPSHRPAYSLTIQTSAATASRWSMAAQWTSQGHPRVEDAWRQLPVPGGMEVGKVALTLQELRDLKLGDAIVLPTSVLPTRSEDLACRVFRFGPLSAEICEDTHAVIGIKRLDIQSSSTLEVQHAE